MGIIRVYGFAGENRASHPKGLNDSVGVISQNQKPGRGDFRPWRQPLAVATVPAGRKTIYRMGRDVASDANYWLSWTGRVHAVRGFNTEDTSEQTFYTGDGVPKVTNNVIGLSSAPYPSSARGLGLPAPSAKPTVAVAATNNNPDVGKHVAYVSSAVIASLVAGDVLQVLFADAAKPVQSITLTGPTVTKATLASQINALVSVDAAALEASDTTSSDGVKVTSNDVGSSFKIQKKTGTSLNFDSQEVTFTDLGTSAGATPFVVSQDWLTANAKAGDRWQVTIDARAPVSITLTNGASTFPPSVTTVSLRAALAAVDGMTLTLSQTALGLQQLSIVSATTPVVPDVTRVVVKKINPVIVNTWSDLVSSSKVNLAVVANSTYFYVYTYVTDWGWESAPSPISDEVIKEASAVATISGFAAPPAGNFGINRLRIYRTQSGSNAQADFFFLREIPLTTASTTDDARVLGEVLATKSWIAAPDDLSRLTALWNGILAGISGNGIRFCEPYAAYAWPIEYEILPPDSKPVALGKFGQTLLVLTTGRPLVVSGSSPEAMDQMPLEMYQGCIAPDSVVSMGNGVAWASDDGLCWYGGGGPRILTAGLMLREDWQKLKPASIVGQMFEGLYLGSFDDGTGGGRKAFFIDPNEPAGIYFLDKGYEAMHFDELQDQLYVLDGGSVMRWDAGAAFMTARFRSKVHGHTKTQNYAAAQVIGDQYPVTVILDAVNMDPQEVARVLPLKPMMTSPNPTTLRFTKTVTNRLPFRLPSGFAALDWQAEITTAGNVQFVNIATSIEELAAV